MPHKLKNPVKYRVTLKLVYATILPMLLFGVSNNVLAATNWSAGTGDWFNAGNWTGGVPLGTDITSIKNGGTAQIGAAGAVSNNLIIGNGGAGNLTISTSGVLNANATFGSILIGFSAPGSLNITGGGVLNITSASNSIAIGTTANGSVIVDGAGSRWTSTIGGALSIRGPSGTLTIRNNGIFSSNVRLDLATSGNGTVNIGSGGSAGVLDVPEVRGSSGTATLNFNHSDANYFFTNDGTTGGTAVLITGSTAVNHNGTGTTFLTGAHTYTGATIINNGILYVNGSNSSSTTTVNAGGTLGGTGTVGSVNINGGTFAPGNSIGVANVTGNVDFSGGGIYQVEVDAAGSSDLINATGTAVLTSGIVQVLPEAGTYNVSTDYTILTAGGGLGGTAFASVSSNLAFLDPTLSYDANNVFLNLTRNNVTFGAVAETPNQLAVSNLLTTLGVTNPTDVQDILNNLLLLTTTGAQQAFDSLSGVQYTHGQVITKRLSQQFLNLLFNRGIQGQGTAVVFNTLQNFNPMSGQLFADNSSGLPASYSGGAQYGSTASERGWWLQGFGGFGDIETTTNASGADYDTQGLAFGLDTEWRDMVIGFAGSYASSDADTAGGNLDVDSYQAATYANWQRDTYYINAGLGFGYHQTDSSRSIVVGATTSTATADYDSYNINATIATGKDIALSHATTFTPFVSVEYTHSKRDSFTETGTGAANLSVNNKDEDSLRTKLGLRLSHDLTTAKGTRITPAVSVAYVREYMDNTSRLEAGFTGVSTTTFQIDGSELDRNRLQIGLGVTGQINETTTLNIGYNGELAGSDDHHNFAATLQFTW